MIFLHQKNDTHILVMVGVTYRKDRDRWQVQFRRHGTGEFVFVGYHHTKEGAMRMYDQYIIDNEMKGYKMNFHDHREKPVIRKRNEIPSYGGDAIPPALE